MLKSSSTGTDLPSPHTHVAVNGSSVHPLLPPHPPTTPHNLQTLHLSVPLGESPCEHVSAHPQLNPDLTPLPSPFSPALRKQNSEIRKGMIPAQTHFLCTNSVAVQKAQSSHRKLCSPLRTRILAEKRSPVQQARPILRREPFGNGEHRCPTTTNHRLHPATTKTRNKKKRVKIGQIPIFLNFEKSYQIIAYKSLVTKEASP